MVLLVKITWSLWLAAWSINKMIVCKASVCLVDILVEGWGVIVPGGGREHRRLRWRWQSGGRAGNPQSPPLLSHPGPRSSDPKKRSKDAKHVGANVKPAQVREAVPTSKLASSSLTSRRLHLSKIGWDEISSLEMTTMTSKWVCGSS